MSLSISSVRNTYSYSYQGQLRPKIDKNDDAMWSKSEINTYASAYQKATGTKLDTEKIMSTYDKDGDGLIGASEQETAIKEDALGLSALYKTAAVETPKTEETSTEKDYASSLQELMASMSSNSRISFANAVFKNDYMGRMWDSFMSPMSTTDTFSSLMNQQLGFKAYSSQMAQQNRENHTYNYVNYVNANTKTANTYNYVNYSNQALNALV